MGIEGKLVGKVGIWPMLGSGGNVGFVGKVGSGGSVAAGMFGIVGNDGWGNDGMVGNVGWDVCSNCRAAWVTWMLDINETARNKDKTAKELKKVDAIDWYNSKVVGKEKLNEFFVFE